MRKLTFVFAALLLTATFAAASSSSGGADIRNEDIPSASAITQSTTVVLKEIGPDNQIKVFDVRTEEEMVIKLASDVPLKAQSKKAFDGRKKLTFADLEAGQRLRLTYRTADGQIVQVKVLKQV